MKRKSNKLRKDLKNQPKNKNRELLNLNKIKQIILKLKFRKDCMNKLRKSGRRVRKKWSSRKESSWSNEKNRKVLILHS